MPSFNTIALVVAAGRGHRFGEDLPKQYQTLGGIPVLRRTLKALAEHNMIDGVRAVIHPRDIALYEKAAEGLDLLPPVNGGGTRQDSVRLGLESLEALNPPLVLIHDGARPFVDTATIDGVLSALKDSPGALPCVPVVDTLKIGVNSCVSGTQDRQNLWRAQTPQGFRYPEILSAHQKVIGQNLTDDCAVAEHAGLEVRITEGNEQNFKITLPEDLIRAKTILRGEKRMRVGNGYDVHRFIEGDAVNLCGVKIAHSQGLEGHSDADVALHAITDAILGAIGAGDIGEHFPPSDPQWKGAASSVFLSHAAHLVENRGGLIENIDVTIICEAPKIGPHRRSMRESIAKIVGVDLSQVSVKGTTTERLGFTGRGEGIAAQAVTSVTLP